jgi:hypothetical protein
MSITVKTDWDKENYVNFQDWNRVESNTEEVARYLNSIQYSNDLITANPSALSFDGVDDFVNLPDDILPVSAIRDNGVTYESLVKMKEIKETRIFGQKISSGYSDFSSGGIGVDTNGKVFFICYDDSGAYKRVTSSTVLSIGQYYHVAGSYSSNDKKIRLYVNGKEEGTPVVINTFSRLDINRENTIGCHIWSNNYNANADIDDCRLWNVARTQEEIKRDMNRELIGTEEGLVGYWKFNEGSGTIVQDSTSNNNDGTISGATYVTTDIPELYGVTGVIKNRTKSSIDLLSSINRIEDNLETIRTSFLTPPNYGGTKLWDVNKKIDFSDMNRLESNLEKLYAYAEKVFKNFRRCGAFTCGGGGLY